MRTHWLFILIGNNDTGKTTLQKRVIKRLCGIEYVRLEVNIMREVTCLDAPRRFATLFAANRSYQEKKNDYGTVEDYFRDHFQQASAAIISSHSHSAKDEIREMIREAKRRYYNVAGVFFSNAIDDEVAEISEKLNWDERIYLENPVAEDPAGIEENITAAAMYLSDVIIGKFTRK